MRRVEIKRVSTNNILFILHNQYVPIRYSQNSGALILTNCESLHHT
jgi:hypothetical protein